MQGTPGADFHKDLKIPHAELIIRKGYRQQMDSYSAFYEADGKTHDRAHRLRARSRLPPGVPGRARHRLLRLLVGARRAQGRAAAPLVIEDACRGIDTNGSLAKAWADMQAAGVRRLQSSDFAV